MVYSIDTTTDNCYLNTTVSINKYDIRDEQKLAEVETLIVATKTVELEITPIQGIFDFEHYKMVHYILFNDLYDWAGQVRTADMTKSGTSFCPTGEIAQRAALIFQRLKSQDYLRGYPFSRFIKEFVDFYCVTNELHPFREGNGRAQRAFLTQLVRFTRYDIDFAEVDGELLMIATIQAASGVTDLLYDIFYDAIRK